MKLRIDSNPEKRLCIFIAAVVFCVFLTNIAAGLSQITGIRSSLITTMLKAVLGLMFILRLNILVKRFDKHLLIFAGCSLIVIMLNYAVFPRNNEYFINTVITFVSFCMTTYIVCYTIEDYELLKVELVQVSQIIAFIMLFFLIGVFSGRISSFNEDRYSMGLGYSCVIPAIILSLELIQRKRIINIIGIASLTIAIITFGSRGPLIELILFIAYFFIRYLIQQKKYLQSIIVVVFVIALLFTYKDILTSFALFLQSRGMRSRVIRTLTTETIYLSGRDSLYQQLIPYIKENPFAIRGINAEWNVIGVYDHNFVIELLYQLGIAVGGSIILLVIVRIVKTLLVKELNNTEIMCIVFAFASIPQLLVSGSLWTHYIFWMWMAMCSKHLPGYQKQMDQIETD